MSKEDSTDRAALLAVANLVRPALAAQPYIPALTHIRFDGRTATAYNDISAIQVACTLPLQRCVPGDLLIRALGSFAGETVLVQEGKDGSIMVSSGRSRVKLPALAADKFPLEIPGGKAPSIELYPDVIRGIRQCLMAVGNSDKHPAQMGVTLDADEDGNARLFSTDNTTISCAMTQSRIELPGDAPVILPTFFCEQLVRMNAAFPKAEFVILELHPGALLACFGEADALVLSKTLVDTEPLDFPKYVKRAGVDLNRLGNVLHAIPPGFDSALDRALLVLSGEVDKKTNVEQGRGAIAFSSECDMGNADDRLEFPASDPEAAMFDVNPAHMARAAKACSRIALLPGALVMASEDLNFVHIISHVKD